MKTIAKFLVVTGLLTLTGPAYALSWQESPEIGKLFSKAGVKGTFVLYDVTADRLTVYNRVRAETRFIPASTFKIPNSLIGLSTGAVKTVDEILPYGGKPQPFKSWEQDMGLRQAIKVSNVPVYQELARRIGLKRMAESLTKLSYGNSKIGSVVDNFWLVGPLKISPVEQTQFLARLAQHQLPFPKAAQAQVCEIVQLEQGKGWTLYAKTGWANSYDPDIGWWVGWVKKGARLYSFAINIDMPQEADVPKRIELGKASLKALGLL